MTATLNTAAALPTCPLAADLTAVADMLRRWGTMRDGSPSMLRTQVLEHREQVLDVLAALVAWADTPEPAAAAPTPLTLAEYATATRNRIPALAGKPDAEFTLSYAGYTASGVDITTWYALTAADRKGWVVKANPAPTVEPAAPVAPPAAADAPAPVAQKAAPVVEPARCPATRTNGKPCNGKPTASGKCAAHSKPAPAPKPDPKPVAPVTPPAAPQTAAPAVKPAPKADPVAIRAELMAALVANAAKLSIADLAQLVELTAAK